MEGGPSWVERTVRARGMGGRTGVPRPDRRLPPGPAPQPLIPGQLIGRSQAAPTWRAAQDASSSDLAVGDDTQVPAGSEGTSLWREAACWIRRGRRRRRWPWRGPGERGRWQACARRVGSEARGSLQGPDPILGGGKGVGQMPVCALDLLAAAPLLCRVRTGLCVCPTFVHVT